MTEHAAALPRAVRSRSGPDRVTVMLVTLAAFLAVFATLAGRLRSTAASWPAPSPRVVLLRRVYETTIVNDGRRGAGSGATTVSVATSGSAPSPAPTTRSSAHP